MYQTLSSLLGIKPRILLVDEDSDARDSYQALLLDWGYDPVLAMGSGIALQDDARKMVQEKRCSLALIDLRLMDNDDTTDISGFNLAKDLKETYPIAPIILSGYQSVHVLRMLNDHPDIPFIGKHDRRSDMQRRLDGIAAKVCATKRGVKFTDTKILDEFLQSDLARQMGEHTDQLANVLASLFPEAGTLAFERLITPGSTVSSAARPNSIVLKVYEDNMEACVVKLARTTKIQKEAGNFRRYISRRLVEGLNPHQLGKEELSWDIGGIAYTYQGGKNAKTFTNYWKDQEIPDVRDALSCFFLETWGKYYKPSGGRYDTSPSEVQNTSLYALYSKTWEMIGTQKK
jgi:CheY-like chemotaxis protein